VSYCLRRGFSSYVLVSQLPFVQHFDDALQAGFVSSGQFGCGPGSFIKEILSPAAFFLPFSGMHIQDVVRDFWFGFSQLRGVNDPVDHFIT